MDYEIILWLDACSPGHGGWTSQEDVSELLEPQIFESVGTVVRENDQLLVIASSVDHASPTTNEMGGLTAIPKSCIIQRIPLSYDKPVAPIETLE